MHRTQLIILWLICCTCCCFSIDIPPTNQLLSSSTQQQSLTATTNSDLIDFQTSNFLSRKQLIKLKRSISRVLEDMRNIEQNLLEPEIDRNQLISLQREANKRMQNLERRITKFIQKSKVTNNARSNHKITNGDQIDNQLSKLNVRKTMQDPEFFFSTSSPSSSSSLSPPVFLSVDAFSTSASITNNFSSINSGSLNSFSNHSFIQITSTPSSNFSSILLSNSSKSISQNFSQFEIDELDRDKVKNSFKKSNSTSLDKREKFISSVKDINIKNQVNNLNTNDKIINHKLIKNKIDNFNKIRNHDFHSSTLTSQQIHNSHNRQRKQPFLLYHKCSDGYLQISDNNALNTGMDPDLLPKSEFIINYLPKSDKHQLQIHTKQEKYICFNNHGRPIIMDKLDDLLCTFDITYHQNEFFQLNSIRNPKWNLGFNKKGLPIRATSHKRKNLKNILNQCTLFIRHRSDKRLLQRLVDFKRYQMEIKQKMSAHFAQIEQIEKINSLQDSLIMSKIEKLGPKKLKT